MCDPVGLIMCDHDSDLIRSIINNQAVDAPIDFHHYTNGSSESVAFRTCSYCCVIHNILETRHSDLLCEETLDHDILFPLYRFVTFLSLLYYDIPMIYLIPFLCGR